MNRTVKQRACQICGRQGITLRSAVLVRPALAELIRRETGNWAENSWICLDDLHRFSSLYVESLLAEEKGELSELEEEVVANLRQQEILATNPDEELQAALTFGQRVADRLAGVAGSWTFIILFCSLIVAWIIVNTVILLSRPFDPYPFILLNLALSCLAAIQAPVIMMSQGRQEARDRLHAVRDYQVNLKAELEIHLLHQKIDHLLSRQWERLVEIQEVQLELMNELRSRR